MTNDIGTYHGYSRLVSGQIASRWQTTFVIMDTTTNVTWIQNTGLKFPGFLKCLTQEPSKKRIWGHKLTMFCMQIYTQTCM